MHVFSSPCHVNIFYMLICTIENLPHQNCKKIKYVCENINKTEKMQKMLIFVYHLKNFDGTEDMGLCRQSHIFYRMQLELLLHPLCVLFKKCLILNKYQNFKKKISKFDGASNFYVQVYYSVLDFHVRNYWKIHKLD
jgi:hypothetical protein